MKTSKGEVITAITEKKILIEKAKILEFKVIFKFQTHYQ